jgi:N-acetylglucosamine PTS system EIICBA or EIICB component
MITTLLAPSAVAMFRHIDVKLVPEAFSQIQTQFIGILSGLIGASCYNRFKGTKLPDALGFFSGKRCVAIVTAAFSIIASLVLFFAWPLIYGALTTFGK